MKLVFTTFFLLLTVSAVAQKKEEQDFSAFKDYYPIAQRPYLSGGFGNNEYEQILFDAKPVVYYGVYNDIRKSLTRDSIVRGDAFYLTLQPQLRMYQGNSKPVKTPSYKALLGWQSILRTNNNNFLTMAIETGHYSNGQTGAAFSTEFEDESEEGQAVYETITDDTDLSAILNRKSGNFSTNLSRLSLNYRVNRFDAENNPKRIHSYTFTYQLYHNNFMGLFDFGGYNPKDIAIYGRHQFELGYEFTGYCKSMRYTVGQEVFLHLGSHPSTDPYRSKTYGVLYPWDTDLGFFTAFSFGFDDYNYRFVDSFPRLSIGVTWDWFTPFVVKPPKIDTNNP